MTQRQPVPESSNWISRGMGRVLGKAREYLLLFPRQEPARADERVTIGCRAGRADDLVSRLEQQRHQSLANGTGRSG